MIRFSMFMCPFSLSPERDGDIIRQTIEEARMAEELGFAGVFLSEHHFAGYNCYSDPMAFGARLSAHLKRAYLGMAVATPALYHPVRFAEQCNLLDQLMEGRFILGVGKGGIPGESAGFGFHHDEAGARTDRAMEIVRALWARKPGDPPFLFDTGEHSGRIHGRIVPEPYRKPHPLLLRATRSEQGAREAAREGNPLYLQGDFRERMQTLVSAMREFGHTPEKIQECVDWSLMPTAAYVSDNDAKAREEITPAFERMGAFIRHEVSMTHRYWPERGDAEDTMRAPAVGEAPSSHTPPLFGGPETIRDGLQILVDQGITHFLVGFNFGEMPRDQVAASIRRFASEVMPHFQ